MDSLAEHEVLAFLNRLGAMYPKPAALYLLGGGALCLLGSPRRTLDIDCTLGEAADQEQKFVQIMKALADEMHLELEVIPIQEFTPIPADSESRHQFVGKFGFIDVFVYDPYTIAVSKLARGLETDLQDILFLLQRNIIKLDRLSEYVDAAIPVAWEYDVDPADLRQYMNEVRRLFSQEGNDLSPPSAKR